MTSAGTGSLRKILGFFWFFSRRLSRVGTGRDLQTGERSRFRPARFWTAFRNPPLPSHRIIRSNQPVHLAGSLGFNSYEVYSNGDYGGAGAKCFVEAVATSFWNLGLLRRGSKFGSIPSQPGERR